MSCDCKKVKRIQNSIPNANNLNKPKIGINKYINVIIIALKKFLRNILIMLILLILMPIMFILVSFKLFYTGKPSLPIPKKWFKAYFNTNKNN